MPCRSGAAFAILLSATSVIACQVPVFRYALERWPADRFEIVILHDAPLDAAEQAGLEVLQRSSRGVSMASNFDVRLFHTDQIQDRLLGDLWSEHDDPGRALMVVLYPQHAREVPDRVAGVSPLNVESARHLLESPARRQVVKQLLGGDSAVWIFVPSGRAERDAEALKVLQEQIKVNAEQLELPPQDELEADDFFVPSTKIELRIGFSVVELRREDPRERWLLQMLLGSEADLASLDQPMAFPVLGRGRVLYALVGEGIAADTIAIASRFIVGPCSCQVKEQNPGFDLLLSVDWDKTVGVAPAADPAQAAASEPVLLTIPPGNTTR